MFAFRLNIKKRKGLFAALLSAAAVALCAAVILFARSAVNREDRGKEIPAKTEAEQMSFLESLGYSAQGSRSVRTVYIPQEFNSAYEEYNALQNKAGFNLSDNKGERAEEIIFKLKDAGADYAVLLVCDGKIIGGHLSDREYGAKMLPLE